MGLLLTAVLAGIGVGAVYGTIAVGYTVIYNATRVFNLAQGDLLMVGVMLSYLALDVAHLGQALAFIIVVSGVTLLSVIEEAVIVRPLLKAERLDNSALGWLIGTLAFSFILEALAINWYGNRQPMAIPSPLPQAGWRIGPAFLSPELFGATAALLLLVVLLEVFQARSWLGKAMRATAEDREAASLRGIRPHRVSRAAFIIGGFASAVGAFAIAPIVSSDPTIGLSYSLKGFIALAVGGFGSIRGAVVGALALGVAEQIFDLYIGGTFEILAGLILLFLVLAAKPGGIFSTNRARVV